MKKQTEYFAKESLRYVKTYLDAVDPQKILVTEDFFKEFTPTNILDAGCGNGDALFRLCDRFQCDGVGVEPSEEAVKLLNSKYEHSSKLSFETASIHQLPFENDQFDLTFTWSVLHWVGRNEYLQALGELIRVTNQYLVIMDFVAGEDYRTTYRHDEQFHTYKMDFEPAILASGIMEKQYERRWWVNDENEVINLQEEQLRPFLNNRKNYHARKMVVFKKNYHVLPTLTESDFS